MGGGRPSAGGGGESASAALVAGVCYCTRMPKAKDLRIKATPEQLAQAIVKGGGVKKKPK